MKTEGWALNNQTMVSVVSLRGRPSKNLVRSGRDARMEAPTRARRRSFASRSLRISPLLIARLTRERIASCAEPRKLRTSSCLPLAKLTAVVEPVEGDFSILADLDEVAVGITHVAAPFPAVIV